MKRLLALGSLFGAIVLVTTAPAADKLDMAKAALQPLNDFVGEWSGNGGPVGKANPPSRDLWSETVNWGWRFKGDDAWMLLEIKNGKYYKSGELRYLPAKKRFQLIMTDAANKKSTFEGDIKEDVLTLESKDAVKGETQQIVLNLAAEGVRMIMTFSRKPENRTLYTRVWQVASTRAGESLGAREKKNECIVTGGLGTMTVSFKGMTYYVCCSGCRDAFNENPEKYVKEWEAKKKGK